MLSSLAPLALLVAPQSVHVVDSAGLPGAGFLTIQGAIDAAGEGDLVLVRDGQYPEVLTIDGKGLALQAETGASVIADALAVSNLTAAQTVSVRGLELAGIQPDPIALADNVGAVWLVDCSFERSSTIRPGNVCRIERSGNVVLRGVTLDPGSVALIGETLYAQDSVVALYDSEVVGGTDVLTGRASTRLFDARLVLYGSTLTGGDGLAFDFAEGYGGDGLILDGVQGTTSVERVDSVITGGNGYSITGFPLFNGQPIVQAGAGGSVLVSSQSAHLLEVPSPLRSGALASASVTADGGDLVFVVVATTPDAFQDLGRAVGPLLLPLGSCVYPLGVMPATPPLAVSCRAPAVAAGFESFHLQLVALGTDTNRHVALGTPTVVHVLDPSL